MRNNITRAASLIVVLFVMLSLTACVFSSIQSGSATSTAPPQSALLPAEGKEELVSLFSALIDLDDEKTLNIAEILTDCGISKIHRAEHFLDYDNNESSYFLEAEVPAQFRVELFLFLAHDGEVSGIYVRFSDITIYIDGEVNHGFLPKEEEDRYMEESRQLINELMTSPDSADYPDRSEWLIFRKTDTIVASSTVTVNDASGVLSENAFQVIWKNGNPVSIVLNGEEYK